MGDERGGTGALRLDDCRVRRASKSMRLGWDTTFTNDSGNTGGGAIRSGGNMDLTDCTFDSNTATIYGGAVHVTKESADATVLDYAGCIFDSNVAQKSGGAVYEGNSNLMITYVNSLFVANEAKGTGTDEGGGAIFNGGSGSVSYVNCTFVGNKATGDEGGGIRVANSSSTTVTNSIFWDNCDGSGCTEDESAQIFGSATVTYCTIEGCDDPGFCADSGDFNKAVQPVFVETGDHPYQLEADDNADLIDDGDGEDTGSDCLSANTTSSDLAGCDRFIRVDGVCTSAADIIDIGAYEVGGCP